MFSLSPFPLKREPTVTAWRGTTLGRDITYAISLIVPLRFVRRLRNNMAQSLVLYVKSDARYGRRLAAPIPSSKSYNPFISALRIGFPIVAKGRFCAKSRRLFRVHIRVHNPKAARTVCVTALLHSQCSLTARVRTHCVRERAIQSFIRRL